MKKIIAIIYLVLASLHNGNAQEYAGPLRWNAQLQHGPARNNHAVSKKTATLPLSLPFFEDFSQYGTYPDSNKWADYQVYVNNTMGASPLSWGVATFDALNANGIPYDSFSNAVFRYADSLTSQPIDLSQDTVGDSVYFSFFYQPQGNGFYPLPQDSLLLYMKTRYGGFIKVWSSPGSTIQPFQQVMIPITDSLYFHDNFQFRFVNIAALYWADAVWNIDYIRLDKNRNAADSTISDVAFTSNPTFLLNDYTFMPYSQYFASPASETVTQVRDSLRNDSSFSQSVNYYFNIRNAANGNSIFTAGAVPITLAGYQTRVTPQAISIPTLPIYPVNTKVVFNSTYYIQSTPSTGPVSNDTIMRQQVFDNYLAYDDGTAEKSYYLNLFPTLPGKIAIEFHLNRPDTLRGMAIYFGRQIPFATNKLFSINVYTALAGVNGSGSDNLIYSTDLLSPGYVDSINHFWYYTFETPLIMPAGTFYAGTMQCANCGADSLYFGLDVNRIGGNHAYYNVVGSWTPSLISGAIMMRPLLGKAINGTGVTDLFPSKNNWAVMPNPATDKLKFEFEGKEHARYNIVDIAGHQFMGGFVANGETIDISKLTPGVYFVELTSGSIFSTRQKIIKL